jgi:hypothetical protein
MALLWFDGFENYENAADVQALSNLDIGGSYFNFGDYGRRSSRGSNVTQNSNYKAEVTGSPDTIIIGFALYLVSTSNPTYHASYPLIRIYDAWPISLIHLKIHVNSSRLIEVRDNANTLLGTTSGHTLAHSTWYYVEIKAKISNTVGQVTINVDEVERLSTSADKDTQNGSNAYAGSILLTNVYNLTTKHDDLYICDDSGSKNNDFLGDIRVDPLRSDAAGAYTQFTPSAGNNYENVDEVYPDDNTTYNEHGTLNNKDTYNLESLPSPPASATIHGFKSQITVRKTDAGAKEAKMLTRSGTTDMLDSTINLSDTFTTHAKIYEDNPDDSAAWEDADINAVQVGVQVTS